METIVAIATPPGRGGVAIVRLSGSKACTISKALTEITSPHPRQAYYTPFYDAHRGVIDQGILLYFQAPNSLTGEDVVEFQSHGSPIVVDQLIQSCLNLGARLAKPGEFSERAFLNDKMDLTQAEAIADLIQASSVTAARMAVRSLQGDFSQQIRALSEQLIHLRLFVEAAIDFPEEEIDFLNDGKIETLLTKVRHTLDGIMAKAVQGSVLREGVSVVIAGRPNAGKSTLINALAGREVAIVTDIAGTTRDVMREYLLLDDIPLHLVDTAGLRDSDNPVEQEGIKRAWQELRQADCVLMMMDATDPKKDVLSEHILSELPSGIPMIYVMNKIDQKNDQLPKSENETVYLSAKYGQGLNLLKEKIKSVVGYQPVEGQFLARRRHLQALEEANALLRKGYEQLTQHRAGELLAEDLRLAHQALCEITGEFSSDDLLGRIFSSFCIGK